VPEGLLHRQASWLRNSHNRVGTCIGAGREVVQGVQTLFPPGASTTISPIGARDEGASELYTSAGGAVSVERAAAVTSPSAQFPPQSADAAPSIRLVIADDSYLVREALEQILARQEGIEVVRSCKDHDSLLAALEQERPDVILTDIRMPPTFTDEGIRLAATARERAPDIGVVVLSQFAEPSYALGLLEAGSAGRAYLLKERLNDPRQLVSAIEAVASGGSVIDPRVVDLLVTAQHRLTASPLAELTVREREVLAEVAQGKSNAAIAESLVLTKRAVEKHINAIFAKLGLANMEDVSRRVKATLMFLAGSDSEPRGKRD
jgi:DNA-binding NarL/FixJ family response regulator